MRRSASSNPKYVAVLAVAAGLILVVGGILRPRSHGPESGGATPLPQAERALLDGLAQRGSLENQIAYFSRIAHDVALHLVRLPDHQVSAVLWDTEGVLVAPHVPGRWSETAAVEGGRANQVQGQAQTISAPPDLPMAVLRSVDPLPVPPVPRVPVVVPSVGEWIVAVWRSAQPEYGFSPALFHGSKRSECGEYRFDETLTNLQLTPVMAGGGLFDQERRLVAVIQPCGDRYAAMSVESVNAAVEEALSMSGRLRTRYGLRVAPLNELLQRRFGTKAGLLVNEIWKGYPADAARLRPGDILETLDGQPLRQPEDLQVLTMPLAREHFELEVRRGERTVRVQIHARPAGRGLPTGVVLADSAGGFQIEAVLPGSAAEQEGIRAGDRVVEIDRSTPRNIEQVQEALADRGRGAFLVIERGNRRWGVSF
jgi:S1-C subfamily serine protease